ncbi:MAG: hypothetical protein Tsb002_36580 [Wenzhouxiangellaceae bacterium]
MAIVNSKQRPWLRGDKAPYHGKDPWYYDPSEFPWVEQVEAQWQVIRDELLAVIEQDRATLEPYKDLAMTDKKDAWKTAGLMYWTFESDRNIAKFPKTWAIIKDIPNLSSLSLLALEGGSSVKPHRGDTNAMIRCHMGLVVPAKAPKCGLRVGNQTKSWEEGRIFMFNDAHEHTAWNNTDQCRYILSFDVMQPQYVKYKNWVSVRVLGRIFLEVTYQNHMWLWHRFGNNIGHRILLAGSNTLFRTLKFLRLPLYNLL